jgi:DNA-binding SARP family transcriptional activator/tetratricopeptide (TPR) repeat protein
MPSAITVRRLSRARWRYVSTTLQQSGGTERTRVQLCGRLSVELDGVEIVAALRGRQVRLLLAYLVINRARRVGREELIGAVWPETGPRSEDAALRTLLSRLRSVVGSGLLIGRDELTLALPEPAWVDLEAAADELTGADEALERGDPRTAWAHAQVPLNIAGRGLLPGAQAPWLEPLRRNLAQVRLHALEIVGRAGLELGGSQLSSVERAGRTLIESEPYRESGYVLLIEALRRQGNVAEGLLVFERLRGLLREELGTAPSPETIAVHARLLHPRGNAAVPVSRASESVAKPRDAGALDADALDLDAPARESIGAPLELMALSSAIMVGRETQLEELDRWWRGSERERALLLTGEAGIGKSRLLAEQARRVHDTGAVVLAGRAPEETVVPFQPFLEAVGQYARDAGESELRAALSGWGPELARLIPEIGRRLPDLDSAPAGDPETDRYRLFEAVVTLLGAIAASEPLLLVLDDLHWADRPTLQLLRHLIRSPLAARVRILGAYRLGESLPAALQSAVAELSRDGLLRTLQVDGLRESEATELVTLRAGGTPPRGLMRALYAETEGSPLFLQELVRHLVDSGVSPDQAGPGELSRVGLPEGIRGLISRRLARVTPDCLEWLRVASVIGPEFEGELLEAALEFDEQRYEAALEEALAAGLVVESAVVDGGYVFGHALIRETLYGGMSSHRLRRLHHRVGIELEQQHAHEVGALALHFARAGARADADRAIAYALRAGAQATDMAAHEEAALHYERALEVLARAHPDAAERRLALLLELGQAHVRAGERPAAWQAFVEAAELADATGDAEALTQAAIGASWRYTQPPGVVDAELIALLERAIAATEGPPTVTRVLLLARLCGAVYYSPRRDEMAALSREATTLAAELDDPLATALAAAARRRAGWRPGNLDARLADSTEILQAAARAGNQELMMAGNAWLAVDLLERGDRVGVDAQLEAFEAGAQRLRQPQFSWQVTVWRAMTALMDGRLQDAERLAQDALSIGMRQDALTAGQYYAGQLLAIRREQLTLTELEQAARELLAANEDRPIWRLALAILLCDGGRLQEARSVLAPFTEEVVRSLTRDLDWTMSMTVLAETAVILEDRPRAGLLYELLAPHAGTVCLIGAGAVCRGPLDGYLGVLALTLGERDTALVHLGAAIELDRRLRAPLQLAYTQIEYARALGPGAPARALLREARTGAATLVVPRLERRTEAVVELLEA